MDRILCTLLLLGVLAGQALGATHAANHVGADNGECAVCASYGNAPAVPPNTAPLSLPELKYLPAVSFLAVGWSPNTIACIHQRGPPPRI